MIDIIDIPHLTIIHKRSLRIISFLFCDPPEFEVTVFSLRHQDVSEFLMY